jgi:hypothetical protein
MRPMSASQRLPRAFKRSPPGMTTGCVPIGSHMSYDSPETAPKKPGAATPTIVKGCELILSCRPITFGSASNRRFQYRSLNTTVAAVPGSSSSGMKPRPSAILAPSTSKKFAVTSSDQARSASRSTTTPTERSSVATMPVTCLADAEMSW